ncbi:MAG TPA: hypothetical protein PLA74_06200 [Syntrophales bacterium]|nr:hypothetical protein [Syntrophales bacterium]HPQ42654.1 hypothetical protein [Syntrophales bacterium]
MMTHRLDTVKVECYSGYKADERPTAFTFRGKRWEVAEIVDRWYEGSGDPREAGIDYFKVRTRQGDEWILRHSRLFNGWAVLIRETE